MVEARTTPGGHDCTVGLCGHRASVGMTGLSHLSMVDNLCPAPPRGWGP